MKCAWELRVLLVHPAMYKLPQQAFSSHLKRLHCSAKLATSYMFVRPNSPSQTAFTLVIALVKETLPVSVKKWLVAGDAGEARALLHISHHRGFVYHRRLR